MTRTQWSRRGLQFAGLLTITGLLLGGSGGSAEDQLEPIPAGQEIRAIAIPQPEEAPGDKPVARVGMKGWEEIQQPVGVEFSRISGSEMKWETILTLTNASGESLKGPVRVAIDELGIAGASVKNEVGRLPDKTPFVEVLAKGKSLPAGKATMGRRVAVAVEMEPAAGEVEKFSPRYRVLVPAKLDKNGNAKEEDVVTFTQEQLDRTMGKQMALDAQLSQKRNKDIFGTATSVDKNGQLQITVYSRIENPADVPKTYDGVPVAVKLDGPFYPLYEGAPISPQATVNTDARFPRPVPIGIGIGNEKECGWVGTLTGRTSKNSAKYVMSNYHVLVPSVNPSLGVRTMQPAGCWNVSDSNSLGPLAYYYPITFTQTASNRYDAAWSSTNTSLVGTRPPEGYGKLGSTIAASLLMGVQKYGRTTKFTKGSIRSVNATIYVSYSQGTARFLGTFEVRAQRGYSQFSAGGDSGSLIVKQGTNQPVGILFAGGGGSTFCCPLSGGLLSGAGMTIDTD